MDRKCQIFMCSDGSMMRNVPEVVVIPCGQPAELISCSDSAPISVMALVFPEGPDTFFVLRQIKAVEQLIQIIIIN